MKTISDPINQRAEVTTDHGCHAIRLGQIESINLGGGVSYDNLSCFR